MITGCPPVVILWLNRMGKNYSESTCAFSLCLCACWFISWAVVSEVFALPKEINSLHGLKSVCEDRKVLLASGVPLLGRDGWLVVFTALDHFSLVMH